MKISYAITCVSIGLLILLVGCDSESSVSQSANAQTPTEFGIKVLLFDSADKISYNPRGDYRIINPDTTDIVNAMAADDFINITVDNNSIKAGPQNYNSRHIILQPARDNPFAINDNLAYHGSLELIINSDNKTMMVINNVSLEKYLAGVVASEMPSYWETEALKAQAVAARTYVLFIKSRFGKNRSWDVKATQANQVYKGVRAETMRTNDAVDSTAGMILTSWQQDWQLFPAYYSSVCGGHTESSENVFGDNYETLKGVDCPWCRLNTKPSLFYWPDVTFSKKTVNDNILARYPSLKELGTIEKIEVAKESVYGNLARTTSVKLIGSTGKTGFLRGEDLRLSIDSTGSKIQSTCCTIISMKDDVLFIAGKGFGHGVGLCQYGAREMARQGKTAKEILDFYYPANRIKILY